MSQSLEQIVYASFIAEVNALKPGNVSQYADGHDMSLSDFLESAKICSPILCDDNLAMGESIYQSVLSTREKVGCNTNLGMLLLFSPVIKAYKSITNTDNLKDNLNKVLQQSTQKDADFIFRAISEARPGGLGKQEQHDVNNSPQISLLEAMQIAAEKDLVARQYVTGYADIYNVGIRALHLFDKRWNSVEWSAVACYLSFLTQFPDSHIRRKYGEKIARQVQEKALPLFERFKNNKNPVDSKTDLLEFDRELKDSNINPGTSADLTAVSLLIYALNC